MTNARRGKISISCISNYEGVGRSVTQTNSIELNGKRYDVRTGKVLGLAPVHHTAFTASSIDGFVRAPLRPAPAFPAVSAIPPKPAPLGSPPLPPHLAALERGGAHHLPHHKPQHAKTLMRASVHRPETSLKRRLRVASHTGTIVKSPQFAIPVKQSASTVDETRLRHAHHVNRSDLITRFGAIPPHPRIPASQQPLLSRPHPASAPAARMPLNAPYSKSMTIPAAASAGRRQPSADIFERALAEATRQTPPASHKPAKKPHRLRRAAGVVASSLAILLIIGFVAYLNETSLQLRLASSRAGVSATLPGWRPEGFTIGKFSYAPGTVTVTFDGTDAARGFSITQSSSSWDSTALLNNFVLPNNSVYNTVQTQDNTIYTFGNNNATWVSSGVWYRLTSNGSLSTTQIAHIAASM